MEFSEKDNFYCCYCGDLKQYICVIKKRCCKCFNFVFIGTCCTDKMIEIFKGSSNIKCQLCFRHKK